MSKIKKQIYLEADTLIFLEHVKEKNEMNTFGQAIDYCVKELQRKQNEVIFSNVVSQSIADVVIKTLKETIQPLMVRTSILDRDMKILMDIVNHNIILDDKGIYAGKIITRQHQKSVPIANLEEEHKKQLAHFKQNADNKKATQHIDKQQYIQTYDDTFLKFNDVEE